MAISPELEAQILRFYHAEKWRIGTIATQLHLHHGTVARVLAQAGLPPIGRTRRAAAIDPYLPFILETLEKFPTLTASRLYVMAKERGYPGRPSQFRHQVALHRPKPKREAYLRLRTLPGEQAQVDWAHFGHLQIGRAKRALMGFVMVLSWSRMIYVRFFLGAHLENFLRGHAGAFAAFGGCPRVLLYDNLKSAVLERQGPAIRFNPTLLAFAGHYRYEPRPVAVARGNEKGRVERAIRYLRDAFFAGRVFTDLDDLNRQAESWMQGEAGDRRCPEDPALSIREAFAQEQTHLLRLPEQDYPTDELRAVNIGKTPYARFDGNDYSVPHDDVQRTLTVAASLTQVRILDGETVVAIHPRSFDKGAQIEDATHIQALVDQKHQASIHRGMNRLIQAVPASRELLTQAAERGQSLRRITTDLLSLLERYGVTAMQTAIAEALQRGVPHPNAVRLALERRREQQQLPPPLGVALPAHLQTRDVPVKPHSLTDYDRLTETGHDAP